MGFNKINGKIAAELGLLAIKAFVVPFDSDDEQFIRDSILNELTVLGGNALHPNVCSAQKIYYNEEEGVVTLTMEHMRWSLEDFVIHYRIANHCRGLPEQYAFYIACEIKTTSRLTIVVSFQVT